VLQRWRAAHGEPRDVVVGVRGTAAAFGAHAWLDDEATEVLTGEFAELLRVQP
jgi:hypothetical protein